MGNEFKKDDSTSELDVDVTVYTSKLFELNLQAQDAVRSFVLHDIDDVEGLEAKRIVMHDTFTDLYQGIASFSEESMGEEFDVAFLRERVAQAEGEQKEQLEQALKNLQDQIQENLANIWMARVMAWLHQAASSSGPFIEDEHEEKKDAAKKALAAVYTMLEKPFSAVPQKVDGTQKLRRVALGHKAYSLLEESDAANPTLSELLGKNKSAEAEFYDEFLNELIGVESTFRQAFNPFDELIWRDMLSSFIFEQATDLYNEALPHFEKSDAIDQDTIRMIKAWKQNTAGLSEVYLAMTYNDIADAQMRSGNLEDASKLYTSASDAFGRAEKCFRKILNLAPNADQSQVDKEHKKAQALFCSAEASVQELTDLLEMNNREEAITVLQEIFRDLKKAGKLSKTRELTSAIKENLKTFSFVEELLKKNSGDDISGIISQIAFAKDLRKTGLIEDVHKSLDDAQKSLSNNPPDALEAIREALNSLGILLSLESEDEEVSDLRNKTLALLNNVKYVIQFQLSSQLQTGTKFIMSRILENLHAEDAASYYQIIGEDASASELKDLGKLALATAYASEAQTFSRQSEQWAFRSQVARVNAIKALGDDLAQLEDGGSMDGTLKTHDETIKRIYQAVSSFECAAKELNSVKGEAIRKKNNVDAQVKQLQGVVMKLRGDLKRLMGAKSDFMAEMFYLKGEVTKAKIHYSDASDQLREAVGAYTGAAQLFQQLGDIQSARTVDSRAKTTDLVARSVWDNKQKLGRDQDPLLKGEAELSALYMGITNM
ncbi:MAG: hypothetical protein BAJATHORv1_50185 [Candidatus Thorarchaeota archaeon]|nr:MAG: hypothetical protein BAJATHORv1_50185 [Candidatus Thorarchaeota archaeon]